MPHPKELALTAVSVRGLLGLVGWLLVVGLPVAQAADGTLATAKLQKSAVACQKVIAQTSAKLLAGKLKALDACGNAALTCVQTKQEQGDCLGKAGQTCAKKLATATAALAKARDKIVGAKSCATDLRLPDLLSSEGLGLGDLAGVCQTDFALDICTGLDPLATCLLRTHERAAGGRYGEARPRAGELLALLPGVVLPPIAGLPVIPGCATCGAPAAQRKAVEQCGKALTKATQGLVASLEKQFGTCAQKVLGCVQTKADTPTCLTGATQGCDKGAGKLTAAFTKFAEAVAKKCDAPVIDFGSLAAPAGLNLAALASCATAPTSTAALVGCLQQRAECTTAALVRQAVARVNAFGESGQLGALGPALTAPCPTPASMTTLHPPFTPRALVFGSILKFLKSVRRPTFAGIRVNGGAPAASPNAGRGVTRVTGPTRIAFGAIRKIPFRYRTGSALTRTGSEQLAAEPPSLIVAIQRADVALDDHFEVVLEPPPGVAEVDDELEVTYQDTIPGCAFNLALATRIDGVVSKYTPLLQVVDVPQPTPTPTAASPTITKIIDANGDGAGRTLDSSSSIAVDGMGNVYVGGSVTDNVFKITPGGTITEIIDASGDGAGNVLDQPLDLAVDGTGNVYVAGASSHNAFKITPGGTITEIIDSSGDGVGNTMSVPFGITVDGSENAYVTAFSTDNVFKITPGGTITEIIDSSGDGVGNTMLRPFGITVDGSENAYVAAFLTDNVFKITPGGTITEIIDGTGDGAGNTLDQAQDVAVDGLENVYVSGKFTNNVFKIIPGGTITEIIGATGDGAGNSLDVPTGIAADTAGNVFVGGGNSDNVFKIASGGVITEIVDASGDRTGNGLNFAASIAVDGAGNVYVAGFASDNAFKFSP